MTARARAAAIVLLVAMGIWAWWWNEIEYVDLNGSLPHYTYFAMWNVACLLFLAVLALGREKRGPI